MAGLLQHQLLIETICVAKVMLSVVRCLVQLADVDLDEIGGWLEYVATAAEEELTN